MGTQFFVVSHWGSVKSATRFAVPLALIRISYYAWPSHLGQVRFGAAPVPLAAAHTTATRLPMITTPGEGMTCPWTNRSFSSCSHPRRRSSR
jgi:hypothetical protein